MNTCQACGIRPAVVEFVQVTGAERRELSLCRECALSIGMRSQVEAFQRLSQLLLHHSPLTEVTEEMRASLAVTCTQCQMAFEQFVKTGLLGCPHCYEEFHDLLKPVLRRMHGVTRLTDEPSEHSIKPIRSREPIIAEARSSDEQRAQLEMELNLALLEEDYERAASLRDRLKKL
ncbi:MAG: hypothetical protein ACOZB3_05050 [Calditrichota bacterium]